MTDQERDQSVLRERARVLAQPRARRDVRTLSTQACAIFERHGIAYAIDASYVRQVVRVLAPTPLPLTDPCWRGLTSLHGELLGIVDLPLLLDATGEAARGERSADGELILRTQLVMVIGRERDELGLVIDALLQARALADDVVPLSGTEGSVATALLTGATPDGVRVVRIESLLADSRLSPTDRTSSAT